MGGAYIHCVVTVISRSDNNCRPLTVRISNAVFNKFVMAVGSKAQIDHLRAAVRRIPDSVSDDRRIPHARSIHDAHRKDLYIDSGGTVCNNARDMGSVSVFVRRIGIVIHKISA